MKKFLIYLSNSHENILKGFIILMTVAVIATLLPHKVRYKFDFQKGKAWNNDDLTAPFDFAIFKDKDSLKFEKQRARKNVLPHFQMDTTIRLKAILEFDRKIKEGNFFGEENSYIRSVGISKLNRVFASGIMRDHDQVDLALGQLVLVKGKLAETHYISELLLPDEAMEQIRNDRRLSVGSQEELLDSLLGAIVSPNVFFDANLTETIRNQKEAAVSPTRGMVKKGELVISRGELVTPEKLLVLESLKNATQSAEMDKETTRDIYWGQFVIVFIAIAVLLIFLAVLRKDIFSDNRKLALIFTLVILVCAAYTGIMKMPSLSQYIVPVCILPIVTRVFFDTRLALFCHVITVLILGSVAPNGYEFVFMQTIAGMVTIFSVTNLRKRAQFFVSAGMIFLSYMICYLALAVIHEGTISAIDETNIFWLIGNVLLTLFSYPLIYIFEKLFGLTSDVSLMELADTNAPLLRELSIKAPGTFQHSMQVANLAESAIFKIGGNSLLIRVGALYHDIGKMDMPLYFIENQTTGLNPHDELSFEESASIIISHVIRGIEKARKNKLPDLIIDFIRTHHGTTMVQYFYQSYLKNYPEEIVDEEDFRYPGPLPFSKETAVLMMADSVEAASRSLAKPSQESINKLVDVIIDSQIEQHQFINCDITFRDISSIKKIFKKMLMSIYHVRVEYPRA